MKNIIMISNIDGNKTIFLEYLRRTPNYLEIIILFDPNHIMSITDSIAINVETRRICSRCSLEKQFIKVIHIDIE